MKSKFGFLVLLIALVLISIGCSKKPIGNGDIKIVAYNLLDRTNTEVPNECKPPLASEENKIAFVHFRGKVNRCYDLITTNTSLNNYTEVKDCLQSIGDAFQLVESKACKATVISRAPGNVRTVVDELINGFYNAHVVVTASSTTTFVWDELPNYFSLLKVWYDVGRDNFYPLNNQTIISDEQANDFEKNFNYKFWDDLQKYSTEWRSTFGEITRGKDSQHFDIFKTMLSVNNKVFNALFASDLAKAQTRWSDAGVTKYPSPLLASMLGEGLVPFYERMKTVARIYDVSCKLKSCNHSFYKNNVTYWLLRYFESLNTSASIEALDGDSVANSTELKKLIDKLVEQETVLKGLAQGMMSVYSAPSVAEIVIGNDFPHFLKNFRTVFAESHDLLMNYEQTRRTTASGVEKAGLFTTTNMNEVNIGFSKAQMERHVQNVTNANNKLILLREKFAQEKTTLINQVLALNNQDILLKDLENQITIDVTDSFNKKNEIEAVRYYVNDLKSNYAKKVVSLIQDQALNSDEKNFFAYSPDYFTVSARNTSEGSNADSLDGTVVHILDAGHQYTKGDVLQITTSGQWSPTCAVVKNYGIAKVLAKTDARGFALIQSEGTSVVDAVSKYKTQETFKTVSVDASACAGISSAVLSAKTCVNGSMGTRSSEGTTTSNTSSKSSRSDASFELGLTLSQTPFTNLPVGSLLLVEIERGQMNKGKIRNIHVLREQNTLILEHSDSDYYLVGNDCSSLANSGDLTVTVNRYGPQGAQAIDYVEKVTSVMTEIESQASQLIKEGQLSYTLLEDLKLRLKSDVGVNIDRFTGQIRTLLDSMISSQMTYLGLKSQLVTMERDLDTKKLRLEGLLKQFTSETDKRKLQVETRNWMLSNLDLDFVNRSDENQNLYTLNRILNTLENSLVSYVDFKYRTNERELILGDVYLLQSLDFTDSFDTISANVTTFTTTLLDNLSDDLNNKPLVPQMTTGIRIPNPYYIPSVNVPDAELPGLYPVMEESRARLFWESLFSWNGLRKNSPVEYELLIDDLYAERGLGCFIESPIIESMGFFFVPENEGYITDFNNNYKYKNAKLFLQTTSSVPFETGLRTYNFVKDDWRYMDAAVRMSKNADDGLRLLQTEFPPNPSSETGLGTGRPLFGRFQIGVLNPWRKINGQVYLGDTPLEKIRELFVGYVISGSNSNYSINLNWINYCAESSKKRKASKTKI